MDAAFGSASFNFCTKLLTEATAGARGPVVAFRLDQDDFFDVMEERGEVLGEVLGNVPGNVLRVLCQRLRRQNEALAAAPAALSGLAGPAQAITS